jgi:hypothetical protein
MNDNALRGPYDSIIEWELDWIRGDPRRRAGRERIAGRTLHGFAIT